MSTVPRYTSSDLDALPDIDGVRYEIIDGDLFVSKQPSWHHQDTCSRILAELVRWSDESGLGHPVFAPGVIFSPDNDVAPDVVWVSSARLAEGLDSAGHLRIAPELVIEVLSPGQVNEHRDRELKLKLYSRQGVREYWIVDWMQRSIQVYRRAEQALQVASTLFAEDTLTSPLLPGFALPLKAIWRQGS